MQNLNGGKVNKHNFDVKCKIGEIQSTFISTVNFKNRKLNYNLNTTGIQKYKFKKIN